jgi:hypothetical protein
MVQTKASAPTARHMRPAEWLLANLPYVSLIGLVGLVVNVVLSFEEPHHEMLLVSGLAVLASPLGVLLHLTASRELTRGEKRAWIAGLVGRRGMTLFAAYLRRIDRRRATEQLVAETPMRGGRCD